MTDISLYPHQETAVEKLRENIRSGVRNQILCAPTGSGKTEMALYMIAEAHRRNKRAVFIVDRISLLDQTSSRMDHYGIPHGVIQAQHWRTRPHERVQLASIQTINRRKWPLADLLVIDECFPGDTNISTPLGTAQIKDLLPGHAVYCAAGIGVVDSVSVKTTHSLLRIETTHGEVTCTNEHPFFAEEGWTQARSLVPGAYLFREEDVRGLWEGILPASLREQQGRGGSRLRKTENLLAHLRAALAVEIEVFQRQNEEEQPHAFSRNTPEDGTDSQEDWTPAEGARWERETDFQTSSYAPRGPWARMGNRVYSPDRDTGARRLAVTLQDRHSQSAPYDRDRGGRLQPLLAGTSGAGREKGRMASQPRVVRVSRIECQSGIPVYNLHVRGHPSFFADGLLVHNCHGLHQSVLKRIADRDTVTIGLTATPFTKGLGKHYDAVLSAAVTNQLITDKFLAPYRVFAPKEPDMTGAKIVAGEWTDDETAERAIPIVGDVVAEWLRHGNNGKTIAFGCTVNHCLEMQRQFQAAGVVAELYTYQTGDDERTRLLEEFRKPDSYIRILISVAALARGFDVPDVTVVICARPLRRSLAEHIQMIGRGLRWDATNPNKVCTILDLAGNTVRFWNRMMEFFENGIDVLDDGKPKPKAEVNPEKEKPHRKCPSCHHVHAPRPSCPECGHEYPKRVTVHEAGDLVAIGSSVDLIAMKQQFYSELIGVEQERGYSSGWAWYTYYGKYKDWPKELKTVAAPPTEQTYRYVRSRQIARAKAIERDAKLKAHHG